MIVVHVHVQVVADQIEAFLEATRANAHASLLEPGVVRFDVTQSVTDPARFVLVEVYRDEEAPSAHKQTAHYQHWRDRVASMMAAPRTSERFVDVFPEPARWQTPAS